VLKDSTPAQRVQVAKELIETGKATPSLVRGALLLPPAPHNHVLPWHFLCCNNDSPV
jgi:hypothetical protein